MVHVIPFEICGLHYILTCSDDPQAPGLQFRLRDEAFLGVTATFSAWSCEDLFSKLESHIEIPLTADLRLTLRDRIETLEGPDSWFRDMVAALGKSRAVRQSEGWGKIAVGMR